MDVSGGMPPNYRRFRRSLQFCNIKASRGLGVAALRAHYCCRHYKAAILTTACKWSDDRGVGHCHSDPTRALSEVEWVKESRDITLSF
jgi:hypothetical protein